MQDHLSNSNLIVSLENQSVADNDGGGTDGIVDGVAVERVDSFDPVLELILGGFDADISGGFVELIPLEGDLANGSDLAQVGTDVVTWNWAAGQLPTLRYQYKGFKKYVAVRINNKLSGGATNNALIASGPVDLSSLRYTRHVTDMQPGS